MKYRGIVFDKDGTLLDFNKTWLPIYRHAALQFSDGDAELADQLLNRHGYLADRGRFEGGSLLAAGNNHEIAAEWAVQAGRREPLEDLERRLEDIFQTQGALQATPVTGLEQTLSDLKQSGRRLGVATADSYGGIINTLQSFGVLELFDFLAGYDSGHGIKPGGGMVLAFCEHTRLDPAQVVVVGDNRHDIEMGRNAQVGMCVGVLTGTSTRAELEDIADHVLDDISELAELL